MSSIYRIAKKLAVQRNQYINPLDGLVYSRAACTPKREDCTADELRADRLYAAQYARQEREHDRQSRKTLRPVYGKPVRKGAACEVYWVARKTLDRSVRRMQRQAEQEQCVRLFTARAAREAVAA